MSRQEANGNPINIPEKLLSETHLTNIRDLPLSDLRGVVNTIKQIEHLAKLKNSLILGRNVRDRAQVDADMAASVLESYDVKPERTGDPTKWERFSQRITELDIQRLLPTNIARELDGYRDGGQVWSNTIRVIREAVYGNVIPMVSQMQRAVAGLYQKHYSHAEIRSLDKPVQRPGLSDAWSKGRILSLAMNWGSAGNREAILTQTYGRLTEEQVGKLLSTLDARDLAFVQDMVDQVNSYWSEIAETQRRRTGLVPEKVEADPYTVSTSDGHIVEVRGGYFPLKYDADRSGYGATRQEMDEVYDAMRVGKTARAATRDGHTIDRVGSGGKAVRLDLDVAQSHMRDVIRDLYLGDAVNYVHNVLHGQEFMDAVISVGKREHLKALDLWLRDVATGEMGVRNALEATMKFVRQNTTASVLAFKASTAGLQLTGPIQTASIIGSRQTLRGMMRLLGKSWIGPNSIWTDIREKSAFMRERFGQIPDAVQIVTDARDGRVKSTWATMVRWGMIPMSRMQMIADAVTWLAAEEKGLRDFDGDVDQARAYADDLVNRGQAPDNFIDKPAVARGTISENIRQSELVKTSTMLLSYMISKGNVAREKYQMARLSNPFELMKFTAEMLQLFVLEGMIMALAMNGLPGENDDKDGDGLWDEWIAYLTGEVVFGFLGTIPLLSQAATEGRGYTAQGVMERAWSQADNATGQFLNGEFDRRDFKSIVNLAGIATGIPSSQINTTADAIWRVRDGEDVSPIEFVIRPEKKRE